MAGKRVRRQPDRNRTYGELAPMNYSRSDEKFDYWWFLCACGEIKELPVNKVLSGNTSSCGCKRKRMGHEQAKVLQGEQRSRAKARKESPSTFYLDTFKKLHKTDFLCKGWR